MISPLMFTMLRYVFLRYLRRCLIDRYMPYVIITRRYCRLRRDIYAAIIACERFAMS